MVNSDYIKAGIQMGMCLLPRACSLTQILFAHRLPFPFLFERDAKKASIKVLVKSNLWSIINAAF